jgi:hypothetical protein
MEDRSFCAIESTPIPKADAHPCPLHPNSSGGVRRKVALPLIFASCICLLPSSAIALEPADRATTVAQSDSGSRNVSEVLVEHGGRPEVFLAIDISGSMKRGHRLPTAITALQRWAESIGPGDAVEVELVAASDHLAQMGTFALGTESGLSAFVAEIETLKSERHSRTSFRAIDSDLADFVVEKAKADERVAVAIISDGVSDNPGLDLALLDLGDRLVDVGSGVYASLSGSFPNVDALMGTAGSDHSTKCTRRPRSRLRRVLSANVSLSMTPSSLNGRLRAKLFGGYEPARVHLQIQNNGVLPRELRIRVRGPDGSATSVEPASILMEGNGRSNATVFVGGQMPVSGEILVTADLPDGVASQTSLHVTLGLELWAISNMRILALGSGILLLLSLVAWRVSGRPLLIAPVGQTHPSVELRRRDIVPVSTFAPGIPADVVLGRGALFGQLFLKSAVAPVSLSGVPLRPHARSRYHLRSAIESAGVTVVLDRVHHTDLSCELFLPSSGISTDGLL